VGGWTDDGEIEYLIIDGYQRFVAQYYAFRDTIDSWKSPPYVYAYVLEERIDVLSLAYISRTINLYERSIAYDLDAMYTFANLFELDDSLLELGNMVGVEDYKEAGGYLRSRRIPTPEVVKGTKFNMVPVEIGKEKTAAVEEEPEEELRKGTEEEGGAMEAWRIRVPEATNADPLLRACPAAGSSPVADFASGATDQGGGPKARHPSDCCGCAGRAPEVPKGGLVAVGIWKRSEADDRFLPSEPHTTV